MSDAQNPEPATPMVPAAPPHKRLIWPWIVGGIGLLAVLTVAAAVVVFVLSASIASRSAAAQTKVVEQVVQDFDLAYQNVDCDAFEAVVDPELRDSMLDGGYTCASWKQIAESFIVDGEYTYHVNITKSEVHGSTATVRTTESWEDVDGSTASQKYVYTLQNGKDGWIIVGYDEA